MQLKTYYKTIENKAINPIKTFKKLTKGQNGFFYETQQYIYLGKDEGTYFTAKDQVNSIKFSRTGLKEQMRGNSLKLLKAAFNQTNVDSTVDVPFTGGLMGNLSYEMIRTIENLETNNKKSLALPEIDFFFIKNLIVYDKRQKVIYLIVNLEKEAHETKVQLFNRLEKALDFGQHQRSQKLTLDHLKSNVTKEQFKTIVDEAKKYIQAGDIFQVVLSQRLSFKTHNRSIDIFNCLRTTAESPYKYYFKFDSYELIGCSPEILIKADQKQIKTVPIAGTIKRGNDEKEDQQMIQQLKNNRKEQSEHLMLVDLARNDLGKVSKINTVNVKNFMKIKKYSNVFHLTSDVVGVKAKDNFEIIRAVFPAGTLTGAPKIRAMEIIDTLEEEQRQLYGGAIGFISFNESMEFLINIRTLIKKKNKAYLQVGAGIVNDSHPALEYQETLSKSQSILNLFGGDINDYFNR